MDFSANELEAPRAIWYYPTLGLLDFNQTAYDEAKKDVTAAMTILENHLLNHQFLASNQITLADITVVSALAALYRELFAPDYVAKFPNVTRWFTYCTNQAFFADVIGKVEFAKTEKQAVRGGKQGKKGGEAKEEKGEEAAPKEGKGKKDKKEKPQKEEKPEHGGKKEKGGKGGKKEAEAPAPSANEALEDALEAERAAEAKRRNVLDELPPSKLVLDDVKRLYFKEKPYYRGFWNEFWGGLWDPAGYCCYYSDYKFQNENVLSFMTGNGVGGFLQRLDKARKYMWGVLNISCVNEDTPPYYITGAWIFRGPDIPAEMKECSDAELYNWTRLDLSKESDRKILMDEFQADNLKHGEVIDRRFFK
jgi:elongation factor 1-gamma